MPYIRKFVPMISMENVSKSTTHMFKLNINCTDGDNTDFGGIVAIQSLHHPIYEIEPDIKFFSKKWQSMKTQATIDITTEDGDLYTDGFFLVIIADQSATKTTSQLKIIIENEYHHPITVTVVIVIIYLSFGVLTIVITIWFKISIAGHIPQQSDKNVFELVSTTTESCRSPVSETSTTVTSKGDLFPTFFELIPKQVTKESEWISIVVSLHRKYYGAQNVTQGEYHPESNVAKRKI